MRTRFLILALAMAMAAVSDRWIIASAAGEPESIPTSSDLGRLQGRWAARAGARKEIQVVLTIKGRNVDVAITTPQGIRLKAQGEVKLDEKSSPRQVDWTKFITADEQEFPQMAGIYKLDGDQFTVCNGGMHGSRPKEFKPGDGVLAEVIIFQREQVAATDKAKPGAPRTK
jgi:uncharacterized protein (TIGR03067 family)